MGRSKAGAWVAGTVVIVLVIALAGWFLAISPQLAEASSARDQADNVASQNSVLRARNAELREQFERLDELKAELAEFRVGIPAEAQQSELLRQLRAVADDNDVFIKDITVAPPTIFDTTIPAPTETAAPEPAEGDEGETPAGEAGDGVAAEDGAEAPAPTGPQPGDPLVEGFVALPLTIIVQGEYADIRSFMADVQTAMDRMFLVATFTGTSLEESEGGNGLPPRELGDVELAVTGMAFVLEGRDTFVDEEEPAETPPLPSGNDNPFMPASGVPPEEDDAEE